MARFFTALFGAIFVLMLVLIFQNGVEFGRWLRGKVDADRTQAPAHTEPVESKSE